MEFHLIKKEAITDEDILEEIKSVMKKLGKSKLTIKEFDANAKINTLLLRGDLANGIMH